MRARAVITAAVLAACACVRRAEPAVDFDPQLHIAGGRAVTEGIKHFPGTPVVIDVAFKDPGTPNCFMVGEVTLARGSSHRWVWLEPKEGCPAWLNGRWWAELATGETGWYLRSISTRPVEQAGGP